MTANELKAIETELQNRGYRKYVQCLTSNESYAWFKTFDKEESEDGHEISGYQIAFRVWDFTRYLDRNAPPYGFDFWTSPLGSAFRTDFTSNWEPICDIDTFERMAAEFNKMARKFINPEKEEIIIKRKKK